MKNFPIEQKVEIIKNYFSGNPNVVAKTWSNKDGGIAFTPVCSNSGVPNICDHLKGKTCTDCKSKKYKPWNDMMVMHHIMGDEKDSKGNPIEYGVYPLLENGISCNFVAADFDDRPFSHVKALAKRLDEWGLHPTIFRSKNRGWHVYVFFSEPVEARHARAIMIACFTQLNMYPSGDGKKMPEIFPKQSETSSIKQFGNLIRLPMIEYRMQLYKCCPVDEDDNPIGTHLEDVISAMWAYLDSRPKVSKDTVINLIKDKAIEVKESASLRNAS
jgi:hypothetical protein